MMSKQIKRLYQSFLIFAVAGFFLFLSTVNPVMINYTDFSIYNTGWNGCSNIALQTYNLGSFQPTITYNQTSFTPIQQSFVKYNLDPVNASIFIIGPQTAFTEGEITYIDHFVSNGGSLLLADDFGAANTLLSGLNTSSRFSGDLMLDLSFEKNASFVTIFNFQNQSHPLIQNISGLLLNYPSSLRPSKTATILSSSSQMSWLDTNFNGKEDATESHGPFPVLSVETYGKGNIVLFSGPSLLINSMKDYFSNEEFKSNLLDYLLDGRSQVIIDESHREMLVPFQIGYSFTSSIPPILKISILLLAFIVFLVLFTPIPRTSLTNIIKLLRPKEIIGKQISSSTLIEELSSRHPTWDKIKIKNLVERMSTNEE